MITRTCLCLYVLSHVLLLYAINPVHIGEFPLQHPGFTTVYKTSNTTNATYDLLVSTFNGIPFSRDTAYIVRDVGQYMDNVGEIRPEVLADGLIWPNEVSGVPLHVFNRSVVAIPQGFLVPTKSQGSILLVNTTGDSRPLQITEGSGEEWFYHRVQWVDMDGDGDFDALTCRARKPIIGQEAGQMLWYENPSDTTAHWTPHVIAQGPDVYFTHYRLNTTDGYKECVFSAQFFTKSLSVYWTEGKDWTDPSKVSVYVSLTEGKDWTDPSKIHSRVIDDTIGAVFDVQVNSIPNDGSLNLFVTTNDAKNGTAIAYDIPGDFRTGKYVKHVLATGFKPRKSGTGKGSPGSAVPIKYIVPPYKRPFLISGDDDGRAYVLMCTSYDWSYTLSPFLDVGDGTVGQLSIEDVNNDYKLKVFIPAYNQGKIYVYQYNP